MTSKCIVEGITSNNKEFKNEYSNVKHIQLINNQLVILYIDKNKRVQTAIYELTDNIEFRMA